MFLALMGPTQSNVLDGPQSKLKSSACKCMHLNQVNLVYLYFRKHHGYLPNISCEKPSFDNEHKTLERKKYFWSNIFRFFSSIRFSSSIYVHHIFSIIYTKYEIAMFLFCILHLLGYFTIVITHLIQWILVLLSTQKTIKYLIEFSFCSVQLDYKTEKYWTEVMQAANKDTSFRFDECKQCVC